MCYFKMRYVLQRNAKLLGDIWEKVVTFQYKYQTVFSLF